MAISLTESAANHIKQALAKKGKGIGLRLGVKKVGCSGLAYTLDYAEEITPSDKLYESHGVKVLVDEANLSYLDGTELDFSRVGMNEAFKFKNPNVKSECGCGESFNVD